MLKPVLGYAANLQNINFIHSQCFVQLLFGYILNKADGRKALFFRKLQKLGLYNQCIPSYKLFGYSFIKNPGSVR